MYYIIVAQNSKALVALGTRAVTTTSTLNNADGGEFKRPVSKHADHAS